jgi:hypothetical protein
MGNSIIDEDGKLDLKYDPLAATDDVCIFRAPKKYLAYGSQLDMIKHYHASTAEHTAIYSGMVALGILWVWLRYAYIEHWAFVLLLFPIGYFMGRHRRRAKWAQERAKKVIYEIQTQELTDAK